jgi:hypothetical protein
MRDILQDIGRLVDLTEQFVPTAVELSKAALVITAVCAVQK